MTSALVVRPETAILGAAPDRQQGDLVVTLVAMGKRGSQLREPLEQPASVVGRHPPVQDHEPADSRAVLGFDPMQFR